MFNKPKNRTFNYQPRFSNKEKNEVDTAKNEDFISKWKQGQPQKKKGKAVLSIQVLIILLVLLLIGIYVLDSFIK